MPQDVLPQDDGEHGGTAAESPDRAPDGASERDASRGRRSFSTSGTAGFYWSLIKNHRRGFIALMIFSAIFSWVAVSRAGLAALLVDGFQANGEGAVPGKFVESFESAWTTVMPADWDSPVPKLEPGQTEPTIEQIQRFFIFLAICFGCVGVLMGGIFFLKEICAQRLIVRMLVATRTRLFRHLTGQSVAYFHDRRSGDLLSRVTNDVMLAQTSLRSIFETLVQQPWLIVTGLTTAVVVQPFLFVCTLPVFLGLIYPVLRSGRKIFRHSRSRQQKLGLITEALQQLFGGIRIVKAFGMEENEARSFEDRNAEFSREYMKVRRMRVRTRALQELIFNLMLAGLLIGGCWLLVSGTVSLGDFILFCGALLMTYEPLKKVTKAWNQVNESRPAIERILEVLRHEPQVNDRPGAQDFSRGFSKIELDDVKFSYAAVSTTDKDDDDAEEDAESEKTKPGPSKVPPAVDGVSLEISAGEVIAFVGPSGSGKSTLVDLIARFYDVESGSILIDGVDIRDLRHKSYLDAIGIVSQDPFLFHASIAENIRYGRPGATDEEIEAAARVANAHDFIVKQADGYDTVIGDRGAKLSGGQRQRLTIARAVLKDAPILILDEATSALDTEAEREVQEGIENLMRKRTSFVIAHRLSTIKSASRIVVLDAGRVVETGTHDDLLAHRGRYYELYTSQNGDAPEAGDA